MEQLRKPRWGGVISHKGENPAGHSETKTVQGRQAACIDYPPTSARDTEAPGKPGLAQGLTARAAGLRCLRFEAELVLHAAAPVFDKNGV